MRTAPVQSRLCSTVQRFVYNSGMAAVIEPASKLPSAELIELRDLRSVNLRELLEEEIEAWRESLESCKRTLDCECRSKVIPIAPVLPSSTNVCRNSARKQFNSFWTPRASIAT